MIFIPFGGELTEIPCSFLKIFPLVSHRSQYDLNNVFSYGTKTFKCLHTVRKKGSKRVLPGTKRGSSKGSPTETAEEPFLVLDFTFFLRV